MDLIRAKIEANAELSKSVLGSGLQGEDLLKKMVEIGTWKLSQLKNLSFEEVKEEFDKLVKYGMNGPEDELENVLWEYLKNMFEAPLSTDPIWSLLGQQRIISWRYYNTCRVHCLNLESSDIYMLTERKYPLTAEVCKAMLIKKPSRGKPDELATNFLKMMKQAGIRSNEDDDTRILEWRMRRTTLGGGAMH
ncbi:hypothetical protein Tco_0765560 [Tanacetum coccineum]